MSLAAAPLLLLAAEVVGFGVRHPFSDSRAGPWFAQHVLLFLGTALLLPAVVALTSTLGRRAVAVGVAGAVLAGAGVLASTSVVTLDFMAQEMAEAGDKAAVQALYVRALDSPAIATLDTVQVALPLGMALLGLGVLLDASVPRWSGISLLVGALFSNPSLGRLVTFGGRLLLLVALGTIALRMFAAHREASGSGQRSSGERLGAASAGSGPA